MLPRKPLTGSGYFEKALEGGSTTKMYLRVVIMNEAASVFILQLSNETTDLNVVVT